MQAQELEVFFCDLCNTSVPQRDLELGVAARVKGRVVGQCCLGQLRGIAQATQPAAAAAPVAKPTPAVVAVGSAPRGGLLATAVVLLAAIAAGAMFLDWRLTVESEALARRINAIEGGVGGLGERLPVLEDRLAVLAGTADLDRLRERLDGIAQSMVDRELRLQAALEGTNGRIEVLSKDLHREVAQLGEGQRDQGAALSAFGREVRDVSRELAAAMIDLRAAARPAPAMMPPASVAAEDGSAAPIVALAPELATEVARLADPDPGTRFEAVDKLLESGDMAVLDALLPMAVDVDPFVRRLTIDGLSGFRAAASVETLIEALGDSESIVRHAAYGALRRLTGQELAYDPDGRPDDLRAGQKRWAGWWEKNRDTF